jgi:hypothetical protein
MRFPHAKGCYEGSTGDATRHEGNSIRGAVREGRAALGTGLKEFASRGVPKLKYISKVVMAMVALTLSASVYAQDKYLLKSPSGIAFSDFRGYEDWAVVSSARTDEVLKVIVANPAMIKAFKTGAPGNGRSFPEGSKIVKLQWKPKKSTEAPFAVDVPDVFTQAFVIEKDSKRFPTTGGWGYALFNYDATTGAFAADAATADCGYACHAAVKSRDYIFHPYEMR